VLHLQAAKVEAVITCDGCEKQADETKDECLHWRARTLPFLPGPDSVKYYCEECWIAMIRATPFGGTH